MKELKFIHITKTGGSSIEEIGKKNKIGWGKYHKEYKEYSQTYNWYHEIFTIKPIELKLKYDWFVSVRNPYTRILSQFHYDIMKKRFIKPYEEKDYNKIRFNEHVRKKIANRSLTGFHYTEQYKYIDDSVNIHILKFENLKEDFENLMKKYNLNINLDKHINKSIEMFSVYDFDESTIELIRMVYKKDFEFFKYSFKI